MCLGAVCPQHYRTGAFAAIAAAFPGSDALSRLRHAVAKELAVVAAGHGSYGRNSALAVGLRRAARCARTCCLAHGRTALGAYLPSLCDMPTACCCCGGRPCELPALAAPVQADVMQRLRAAHSGVLANAQLLTGHDSLEGLLPRRAAPLPPVSAARRLATGSEALCLVVEPGKPAVAVLEAKALVAWHQACRGGDGAATGAASGAAGSGAERRAESDGAVVPGSASAGAGPSIGLVSAAAVGRGASSALADLPLLAFPGCTAPRRLRRDLAELLLSGKGSGSDGPLHTLPWDRLAQLVAASEACRQQPSLASPSHFVAFLQHPASAVVFAVTYAPLSVSLDVAALRRAAVTGSEAAFASAFPGPEPLAVLRRAAARMLAAVTEADAGPYTMKAGSLGNALRDTNRAAFEELRSANKGLMANLPQARVRPPVRPAECGNSYLVYVLDEGHKDGGEGHMRLLLRELLASLPSEGDGVELGEQIVTRAAAMPPLPPAPTPLAMAPQPPQLAAGLAFGDWPATSEELSEVSRTPQLQQQTRAGEPALQARLLRCVARLPPFCLCGATAVLVRCSRCDLPCSPRHPVMQERKKDLRPLPGVC